VLSVTTRTPNLSLPDALPILLLLSGGSGVPQATARSDGPFSRALIQWGKWAMTLPTSSPVNASSDSLTSLETGAGKSSGGGSMRLEEHTPELQPRGHLLCRLL